MIPQFNEHGLLPPGIHDCTMDEISGSLCFTDRRHFLFQRLKQFVQAEWTPLGLDCPLLIDGSFTRNKPNPDDIDVVMDLTLAPQSPATMGAIAIWLRHAEIKEAYNLDVWPKHPAFPEDLGEFFQYLGDKAAAELRLPIKHPKGILRIQP